MCIYEKESLANELKVNTRLIQKVKTVSNRTCHKIVKAIKLPSKGQKSLLERRLQHAHGERHCKCHAGLKLEHGFSKPEVVTR